MSLNNYAVALNCLLFILMTFSEINGILLLCDLTSSSYNNGLYI